MCWRSFVKIVSSAFQNSSIFQLVHGDRHCKGHLLWEGFYTAVIKLCLKFSMVDIFGGCQEFEVCTATKLYASWLWCLGRAACAWGPATLRTAGQQDLVNLWSMMLTHMSLKILQNWCNCSHDGFNKICYEYSHLRIIILHTSYEEHFVPLNEFGPHQTNIRRTVFLILNSLKILLNTSLDLALRSVDRT
jgi:hypothetical protein